MVSDPYSALASTLTKDEIEDEVEKKIANFHGLLTRDVALKLIAKERGLFKEEDNVIKIKDIKPGMRKITFSGKILAINKEIVYPSGKRARSIVISDDTANVSLILWNDDISIISKLKVGDEVLVKSAYEKLGSLNLGYKGTLEIVNAVPYSKLAELAEGQSVNVRAFIVAVKGKRVYEKNGKESTYFSFDISDSTGERTCIIWGAADEQKMVAENEIIIQNGLVRNNEIHITDRTRLLVRKTTDVISGKLIDMSLENNKLIVNIDKNNLIFNRENALKFFGIDIRDDISLETIVNLKKESMLNTNVYISCKEKDGEHIILD